MHAGLDKVNQKEVREEYGYGASSGLGCFKDGLDDSKKSRLENCDVSLKFQKYGMDTIEIVSVINESGYAPCSNSVPCMTLNCFDKLITQITSTFTSIRITKLTMQSNIVQEKLNFQKDQIDISTTTITSYSERKL